jgi:co-chaperonin GroES (HSP10)
MEPRLIKGLHAEYVPAKWNGKNESGVRVVGKTVLVLMDECSAKSSGGIDLPEDLIERMSMASESGIIVAVAPGAFLLNEDMTPWMGAKPQPGDRAYIEKYAGKSVKGRDGKTYRLMDYGSIGATYESDMVGIPAVEVPSAEVRRFDGDPPEDLTVKGVHTGFSKRSA